MEDQPLLSQDRMTTTTDFNLHSTTEQQQQQRESTTTTGNNSSNSNNNNNTMPSAIAYLNEYKGQGVPNAIVPILGGLIGTITPIIVYYILSALNVAENDDIAIYNNVLVVIKKYVFNINIIFVEFIFGVLARSKSAKAGFSPAAIQASGNQPFEIIEANRIHQNHIESACIFIPASLSASAAGGNTTLVVATIISWVVCRFIYRYGYGQHHNPLWRIVGTVSSVTQSFICYGLFVYAIFKNK